jgi:cyclopropane fatty-acyl-phospholipid synthase-like methyltransferase
VCGGKQPWLVRQFLSSIFGWQGIILDFFLEIVIVFSTVIVALCLGELIADKFGAPWAPTSKRIVQKMLIIAKVCPDDLLVDLGSGDGRIIIRASMEFGARSLGIEINPLWVLWTRLKVITFGLRNKSKAVWADLFKVDLSDADVVTLYLHQGTNDKLREKLERELKPGARVVSHVFTFKGWTATKVDEIEHVYLYIR